MNDKDRISRQGTEAWCRVKRERHWHDWRKVGEAHLARVKAGHLLCKEVKR